MSEKDINIIANELHKPVIKHFPRRKVIVNSIDEIWSADLVFMRKFKDENKGIEYLLTVIDCFSRFAWAVPLLNKSAQQIIDAFKKIFNESGRRPQKLWVDKGSEFVNKDVKNFFDKYNIKIYHTQNETKGAVIERFNRTLKSKMFKLFSINSDHIWIKDINKLVKQYNNTFHTTIGMTPTEGSQKKNEKTLRTRFNEIIYNKLYEHKPKFKVGEKVRISKAKGTFEKGYLPSWSYEVFKITKVRPTIPVTYEIEDLEGEPIIGTFYEQELQKTTKDNVYIIEKKLKSRFRNGEKEWFVKWQNFPEKYNSWIKEKDIT